MPSLDFTLPHWLYLVGLIVFPLVAMALARRPLPEKRRYSLPLGYLILVTGGMLGLHRFYLKNLLGLVFIPIFILILLANGYSRDARSQMSDASNLVRVAERTIEREEPRLAEATAALPGLRTEAEAAEEGSFAQRRMERQVERAEEQIANAQERLERSRIDLAEAQPVAAAASADRAFWSKAARYSFYLLLLMMAVDALLLPGLVSRANRELDYELGDDTAMIEAVEAEEVRHDSDYAKNWIDRLSLFCGEFVSYWAVIAVFVYYYEVLARYVFNSPTNWAHEAMYLMFGMQYLIAGSYAMLTESHVRVDIFYAPLSKPRKAWVDLFTSIFFFIFAGTLLATSWIFAMDAIAVPTGNGVLSQWARGEMPLDEMLARFDLGQLTDPRIRWGEISFNEWEVPLWPMKWMMVVGGLLLVLQGVSKLSKDIRTIARGA
ncbi:TRAP-type mannitol/chloroaromatic compound transport system, small permease component [Poseidonocella pacifica]|uniref:TRAP transporter small permease protein n=1 Tax=Poseidonocella pacifica TaxID=871651 RepID=A0A1I0VG99_9RHOB|nr:TRAP transporter small permease subunit [Poseidonocella pacifica]SFA75248.1 TRAP-type mannitol/chloroaromatic compound transport system, small permease component [Poseidonocella pacifica]